MIDEFESEDIMFSGSARPGGGAGTKRARGRKGSPAAKAAATRRTNARSRMTPAQKSKDTRDFNNRTGKYAKKRVKKAAGPPRGGKKGGGKKTGKKSIPRKR